MTGKYSATMDDSVNKKLLAFLNGLARRKYFGDDISDELLKDQVLEGIAEEGKRLQQNKLKKQTAAFVTDCTYVGHSLYSDDLWFS